MVSFTSFSSSLFPSFPLLFQNITFQSSEDYTTILLGMLRKAFLISSESFLNRSTQLKTVYWVALLEALEPLCLVASLKGAQDVINRRDSLKYLHLSNINIIHYV